MKSGAKSKQTMMSKKYYSMLLGGTLTYMVVSLVLMSDSVIAGIFIGSDAVAGVTLVTPLYSFAVFFGSLTSLGVPILYSTEMGKFNKERADQVFGLGVLMSIVVGVALFILTFFLGEAFLRSANPTKEVLEQAMGYLFYLRFTVLLVPMQNLLGAVVYSDGDETISTIANLVQGVGNIVCSCIFSRFMGIKGIALASLVFYVVSMLIMLVHFTKKSNSLRLNLYFSFDILRQIVRFSIIDSSSYLFLSIISAVLNAFVSSFYGPRFLILVSVVTLTRELQLLFEGIGEAVGPILSVYVGERNHEGLRATYSLAQKTAIIEGIAVMVLLMVIAPFIAQVLNVTDPELFKWVVLGVRLISIGSVFMSLLYLLTSYYLVIDQIILGTVACALRDVLPGAVLGVVLGRAFGITGMFFGLGIAPVVAYALLMVFVRTRYGKKDWPLLLSKVPGDDRSYLFQFVVEPKEIIGTQKEVEGLLIENNVDGRTIGKIKLLIEELYILISEKNEGKKVLSELTVFIRPDGIQLISKDDGELFDISEDDVSVTSIASFVVSNYMEKLDDKRHLTTMSYNRSSFLIQPDGRKDQDK